MRFYTYCLLYIMTQLYSNLVCAVGNTTYLCLVLAVLCSPVVSEVRLALLYTAPLHATHHFNLHLGKHSPFIDHGGQRRMTHDFRNKESTLLDGSRHFPLYHLW